jgi:hypothetical protein
MPMPAWIASASSAAIFGSADGGGSRMHSVYAPVRSCARNEFSSPTIRQPMPAWVSVVVRNCGTSGVQLLPLLPGLQSAQISTRAAADGVIVSVTAGLTVNVAVARVTGEPVRSETSVAV